MLGIQVSGRLVAKYSTLYFCVLVSTPLWPLPLRPSPPRLPLSLSPSLPPPQASQKGDPVAMLKKQLDEKEKQLAAEQDDAVAAKSRLREMTKVELCYSYLVQLMKRIPCQNE